MVWNVAGHRMDLGADTVNCHTACRDAVAHSCYMSTADGVCGRDTVAHSCYMCTTVAHSCYMSTADGVSGWDAVAHSCYMSAAEGICGRDAVADSCNMSTTGEATGDDIAAWHLTTCDSTRWDDVATCPLLMELKVGKVWLTVATCAAGMCK